MSKTVFVSAVLAAATLLTAGLVVFPGSVQEAQANNPCITNAAELDCDLEGIGSLETDACGTADPQNANAANLDCDFKWVGDLIINVHSNDILIGSIPFAEFPLPTQ